MPLADSPAWRHELEKIKQMCRIWLYRSRGNTCPIKEEIQIIDKTLHQGGKKKRRKK